MVNNIDNSLELAFCYKHSCVAVVHRSDICPLDKHFKAVMCRNTKLQIVYNSCGHVISTHE